MKINKCSRVDKSKHYESAEAFHWENEVLLSRTGCSGTIVAKNNKFALRVRETKGRVRLCISVTECICIN